MAARNVATQLTLDLFGSRREERDPIESFMEYARDMGCVDELVPYVRRAYDTFGRAEAFDRCKALLCLAGTHKADGYDLRDAEMLGVYDRGIDYHTCWDRKWAIRAGLAREQVARVIWCDYKPTYDPGFYDKDGNLIARGHVKSPSEAINGKGK